MTPGDSHRIHESDIQETNHYLVECDETGKKVTTISRPPFCPLCGKFTFFIDMETYRRQYRNGKVFL